jgi:hypothetical protein
LAVLVGLAELAESSGSASALCPDSPNMQRRAGWHAPQSLPAEQTLASSLWERAPAAIAARTHCSEMLRQRQMIMPANAPP